jgi:DNA-binding protein HU-beta
MNKAQLIAAISAGADIPKSHAEAALNAFQDAVTKELAKGEEVVLAGFGKFSVTERAARTGRNPATGEPMEIAASKSVSFKAQKALKDAVNA